MHGTMCNICISLHITKAKCVYVTSLKSGDENYAYARLYSHATDDKKVQRNYFDR